MFALIITLISIALVAALALATLYYGGPIFNQGADRVNAARVAAQGQQIMGALELYRAERGVYPNALADLVSEEYLKSIPVAQADEVRALSTALAAPGIWSLSSPGQPVIVLKPVSLATCLAYNKTNLGTSGVLQQARSTHLKQCIGTDVNNLMVVQPKASADLVYVANDPTAVVQIGPVRATPLPPLSDTTLNGWLPFGSTSSSGNPPTGLGALSYSVGMGPTTSVSFPDTEVDQTATPLVLTVTNTGTATMTLAANPASTVAPYSVNPQTCASAVLAVGASCQMSVGFAPTLQQAYTGGSFRLTMSAVSGLAPTVNLSGTGIAPLVGALSYSVGGAPVTSLSFPSTPTNQPAAPQVLTVTNTGTAAMTLAATPASTVAPYSVDPQTCASAVLSVGASCQMSVGFAPTAQQAYNGGAYQLTLNASSGSAPALSLSGTGEAPLVGVISYAVGGAPVTSLSFPNTPSNRTATPQVLTVTNTGTAPMTLAATPASTVAPYSVTPQTCAGAVLAIGASCQMSVGFAPTAQQAYTGGSYRVTMNALSGTAPDVPLAGTGTAPLVGALSYSVGGTPVTSLSFPSTPSNQTATPLVLTVTNTGTASMTLAATPATTVAPYSVNPQTCASAVLAVGASCQMSVGFAPTAQQSYNGGAYQLTLNASSGSTPAISLSGTGTAPLVGALSYSLGGTAVTSLSFPNTPTNQTATPLVLTVTNTGTASMTLAATPATTVAPYSVNPQTCASAVLAIGASCQMSVGFAPTAQQAYTGGSYRVTMNALSGTAPAVPLAGTGIAPVISYAPFVAQLSLVYNGSSMRSTWSPRSEADFSRFGTDPAGYVGSLSAETTNGPANSGAYGLWPARYETGPSDAFVGFNHTMPQGVDQFGDSFLGSPTLWNSIPGGVRVDLSIQPMTWGGSHFVPDIITLPLAAGSATNNMTWCVTFDMTAQYMGYRRPTGVAVRGTCPN